MKKIYTLIVCLIIIIFIFINMFPGFYKENKKIKVAEVTHSIFYAPLYVAYRNNYFKDEGLDIEIILMSGADKVTSSVLSDEVDIGFCGSEATIYIYNEGVNDYLINFAGLTKKDGSFIVGRSKDDDFTLSKLKNKHIIGGRTGGMPAMTLEWLLKENGFTVEKDLYLDTSIAFAAMSGAFIGGQGDYVTLFEPNAYNIEKTGYGYVVASLGELGGEVPYTVFNAKKSYIKNNTDIIKKFTKAIERGLKYVHNNDSSSIANIIKDEFPDISIEEIALLVDRYKKIDSWYDTTYISKDSFEHIKEILNNSGELKKDVNYEDLVITSYSKLQ